MEPESSQINTISYPSKARNLVANVWLTKYFHTIQSFKKHKTHFHNDQLVVENQPYVPHLSYDNPALIDDPHVDWIACLRYKMEAPMELLDIAVDTYLVEKITMKI